jgi:hypothetical protein
MGNSFDIRRQDPTSFKGMEIFEVRPVILGGSPTDPRNKTALTRKQHIEAVRYWNRIISNMRKKG